MTAFFLERLEEALEYTYSESFANSGFLCGVFFSPSSCFFPKYRGLRGHACRHSNHQGTRDHFPGLSVRTPPFSFPDGVARRLGEDVPFSHYENQVFKPKLLFSLFLVVVVIFFCFAPFSKSMSRAHPNLQSKPPNKGDLDLNNSGQRYPQDHTSTKQRAS